MNSSTGDNNSVNYSVFFNNADNIECAMYNIEYQRLEMIFITFNKFK